MEFQGVEMPDVSERSERERPLHSSFTEKLHPARSERTLYDRASAPNNFSEREKAQGESEHSQKFDKKLDPCPI